MCSWVAAEMFIQRESELGMYHGGLVGLVSVIKLCDPTVDTEMQEPQADGADSLNTTTQATS